MSKLGFQKTGYICRECKCNKFLRHFFKNAKFCLWCWKDTPTDINVAVYENITLKESLRVRRKGVGFKKFISEFLGGWFPSGDQKLKDGVHKTRSIDKERDAYAEVVKDYRTGKKIHECHEPLSEHKKNDL